MDGALVHPRWAGREVPVPPEWVRRWSDVPERSKLACLAAELEPALDPKVRSRLVEYVKVWPEMLRTGQSVVIAGHGSPRGREWCAAGLVNEIVRNYATTSAMSAAWTTPRQLQLILDGRQSNPEFFNQIKAKLCTAKLLMFANPMSIPERWEHRWFLEHVYDHRYNHRLPTVTTLGVDLTEGWKPARTVLGHFITDTLETTSHGWLIHY